MSENGMNMGADPSDIIGLNITTKLFHDLSAAFIGGHEAVQAVALKLIAVLMSIDLLMAMLMHRDDGEQLRTIIMKVLRYGFFFWIVSQYQWIVNELLLGFKLAGATAGSYSGGISDEVLADPALLISYGLSQSMTFIKGVFAMQGNGGSSVLANQPYILGGIALWGGIVYAFLNVATTIIITLLEFYITATLALMMIPFGVYEKLAYIGENALKAVVSQGVRVMVVTFIASVVVPIMRNWSFDFGIQNGQQAVTFQEGLYLLMAAKIIEKVIGTVPGIAAALIGGSSSHTTGWGGTGGNTRAVQNATAGLMGGVGALAAQMGFGGGQSAKTGLGAAVQGANSGRNSSPDSGQSIGGGVEAASQASAVPTVSQVHNRMENSSTGSSTESNVNGNAVASLSKSSDRVNAKMAPANNEQPPKLT